MITPTTVSRVYRSAKELGLIHEEDTAVIFMDYHILQDRVDTLKTHFPPQSLHAVAVKSNPLLECLKTFNHLGVGLEVASIGELMLAKAAGVPNNHIVFDSPVKTKQEIDLIVKDLPGLIVNANSLAELERYPKQQSSIKLGLRVNPEVNTPSFNYLSVGSKGSKFGESISRKKEIIQHLISRPGVSGLHIHTGSQISTLRVAVSGIRKVLDLAIEYNNIAGYQQLSYIDIGGGFPVNYQSDVPFDISDYVTMLRKDCPALFNDSFQIITEFGRYVHAHAGWVVSDIEYVQPFDDASNLLLHVGADMFSRECYNPGDWFHRLLLLDKFGKLKEDNSSQKRYNLMGPLCFGGDVIDRNRFLPFVEAGDKLVIMDTGANSHALWSKHCSRPFPKVIAYDSEETDFALKVIRKRETYDEVIRFWN